MLRLTDSDQTASSGREGRLVVATRLPLRNRKGWDVWLPRPRVLAAAIIFWVGVLFSFSFLAPHNDHTVFLGFCLVGLFFLSRLLLPQYVFIGFVPIVHCLGSLHFFIA